MTIRRSPRAERPARKGRPPRKPRPPRPPRARRGAEPEPVKETQPEAKVAAPAEAPKKKGKWYNFGSNVGGVVFPAVLMAVLIIFLGSGCGSGNARLETGGAYAPIGQAPDYAFYAVESGYALALAAFKTASRLEIDNREMFWSISPDIKHTLDEIRPQALAADRLYAKARTAYVKNPTPDGLSGLRTILGQIQQLATAAVAAIPNQKP